MSIAINKKNKAKKQKPNVVVDSSVGSYEKHPFFVKKANETKALIKEVGLPKEITRKK